MIFSGTGVNKEKLWLHYNFLVPWDEPAPDKPHVPAFVLMTEALELCRTIEDVEALLNTTDRDGGMLLVCGGWEKQSGRPFRMFVLQTLPPRAERCLDRGDESLYRLR
jgi:hypothetical protein